MMKKISQSTLDFINKNISTNAQASSYPLRKQFDIKDTSPQINVTELSSQALNVSPVNSPTFNMTEKQTC